MTTDEAFNEMINTRGIYHKLEMPQSQVGALRNYFKTKKRTISLDLKIKLLEKAGYKIIQQIIWKQPA